MPSDNPPILYNLFWFSKQPGAKDPAPVARKKANTLSKKKRIKGIILYPALATPEVLVGDDDLEILLLTQGEQPRLKSRILDQLKVTLGLDASKPAYDHRS